MTVTVKPDDEAGDELPILLSQQISPDTPVRCIGVAKGADRKSNYEEAFQSAVRLMHENARKMGGDVVIDPQLMPIEKRGDTSLFVMFCKVGKHVEGGPVTGSSED